MLNPWSFGSIFNWKDNFYKTFAKNELPRLVKFLLLFVPSDLLIWLDHKDKCPFNMYEQVLTLDQSLQQIDLLLLWYHKSPSLSSVIYEG